VRRLHLHRPLLSRAAFFRRLSRNALVGLGLIAASLGVGCVGYRVVAGLSWIDSLLNASMILTGMGPVDPMASTGAKLFASFYAIFSGVAFLTIMGVVLAPVAQRFLHRFHLELDDTGAGGDDRNPPPSS
jgi:hypothetical protein